MRKSAALASILVLPLLLFLGRAPVRPDGLREQAERVFAFDRTHPDALPAQKVRALSLALAFHDRDGARSILGELAPRCSDANR